MSVDEVAKLLQSGGLGRVLVMAIVALMYMVKRFIDFLEASLKAQNEERKQREEQAGVERDKRDLRE